MVGCEGNPIVSTCNVHCRDSVIIIVCSWDSKMRSHDVFHSIFKPICFRSPSPLPFLPHSPWPPILCHLFSNSPIPLSIPQFFSLTPTTLSRQPGKKIVFCSLATRTEHHKMKFALPTPSFVWKNPENKSQYVRVYLIPRILWECYFF